MNRAQKRIYNKLKSKQQNKIKNGAINFAIEQIKPCAYVNNEPVYAGACVFLKPDNEIIGQYDWNLCRLIDKGHRFVILMHLGLKKSALVVSLLSTSKYLNEEQKLGIRLNGNYHPNKYVYMDAKNSYVINSNCIKSVDYNLTDDDRCRCRSVITNSKMDLVTLHKGLLENNVVDKYYSIYNSIYNNKFNDAEQAILDLTLFNDYVDALSLDEVYEKLKELKETNPDVFVMASDMLMKKYESLDYNNIEEYSRELLVIQLSALDHFDFIDDSMHLQLGY